MRSVTRIMKFSELSFISSHSHFFTLERLHYVKEGATSFMEKGISPHFRLPMLKGGPGREGAAKALDPGQEAMPQWPCSAGPARLP